MSPLCLLTLALACTQPAIHAPPDLAAHPDWGSFQDYSTLHDRTYDSDDLRPRFSNFVDNVNRVANSRSAVRLELNEFADLTASGFKKAVRARCTAFRSSRHPGPCAPFRPSGEQVSSLPDAVDWRSSGAVTPVKNQGKCGSCWSFSATGAMEGAWARATGQLVSLSEQQLIDCSQAYGNHACDGGIMPEAFQYAIDHGMCTEHQDPYHATAQGCEQCQPSVFMDACKYVEAGDQAALKAAVAQQPVSVAIEADASVFQLYAGGVIDTDSCGTSLDHGVLIVGYGTDSGEDYWIVKNSWGPEWGESGYVRIARSNRTGDPGVCGIALQASFPVARMPQFVVGGCNLD